VSGRRGTPCRKFTLMDGMILIAGIAVGFTGFRAQFGSISDWERWIASFDSLSGFTLMLMSALVLVFRLRRPRPTIRRVFCQPGAVACFTAVAFGFIYDVQYILLMAVDADRRMEKTFSGWVWWIIETPGSEFAWIVPITWVLMLLSRRWRPELGWIDRSGFLVGWGWIIWGLASPFLP
jgi:hypothetical protein